jgi:hypothetical protein
MASIDVFMKLCRQFISFIMYFWLPFQQTAWINSAPAGRIFMTLYHGEVVVVVVVVGVWWLWGGGGGGFKCVT